MRPMRKCPVCENHSDATLLYAQKFAIPDVYIGIPEDYNIVSCCRCGCIYSDVDASQADYDRYYEKNSKYEVLGMEHTGHLGAGYVNYFRGILQVFKEYLTSESVVLDIGCATGGMLAALKSEGFHNIAGMDMSGACAKAVRSMGIDCYQGDAFNLSDALCGKFDLIIMTQTLEHIYDIKRYMHAINRMLKEDGMLYLDVPDASEYHSHYIKPFHYFDIEHINHFTVESMVELGLRCRFACLKTWGRARGVSAKHSCYDLAVLFRKSEKQGKPKGNIRNRCESNNVLQYIEMSIEEEKNRIKMIHSLIDSREAIIIWSAGAYCFHLLRKGLEHCNVAAIVDNDKKKHGMIVSGIEIRPPEAIKGFAGSIVVASAFYEEAICAQINHMGLTNNVILF